MQKAIRIALTTLFILALFIAQTSAIGFEIHRFFFPSWIFLLMSVLLLFTKSNLPSWVSIALLAVTIYFGLRGSFSAVPSLTLQDHPVIYYCIVSIICITHLSTFKRYRLILVCAVLFLHLLQLTSHFFPEFFIRTYLNTDKTQYYGFFQHRNPFSSYNAISLCLIFGLLFYPQTSKKRLIIRNIFLTSIGLITIFATYTSASRMGLAVNIIAIVTTISLGLIMRYLSQPKALTLNRIMVLAGILSAALFTFLFLVSVGYKSVAEKRGKTGVVSKDLMSDLRIPCIGIGMSMWLDSPVTGQGPRAFSYELPRKRAQYSNYFPWTPDAAMVHNDFVQTLAEYGIVGLALLLSSVAIVLYSTFHSLMKTKRYNKNWLFPSLITLGPVIVIFIQSTVDFTAHILPVALQLVFAVSLGLGIARANLVGNQRQSFINTISQGVLLFASTVAFMTLGWKQITNLTTLVKYEYYSQQKLSSEKVTELTQKIIQNCPDPFLLEKLGRNLLHQINSSAPEDRNKLLHEAEKVYSSAYALHPRRIELIANYARVQMEIGNLKEAQELIIEGFIWSGDRWKNSNIGVLAESYLIKAADHIWMKRNPDLAMAYYQKAREYNKVSYLSKNVYGVQSKFQPYYKKLIDKNLKVLELGNITAQEGIEFFDGYGL